MNTEPGTITDKQRKTLFALMQDGEVGLEELENSLTIGLSELSTLDASELIDCFMNHGDLAVAVSKIKSRHKEGKGTLDNVKDDKPTASSETVDHPEHANQSAHTSGVPKTRDEAIAKKSQSHEMNVEKASDRVTLMASLNGIPKELANMYFMIISDQLYVKSPGLLYMASKKGYSRIDVKSEKDGEGYVAEARIYPNIPVDVLKALSGLPAGSVQSILDTQYGPTIGYAKANKNTVQNSRMMHFMRELAETRAVNRALRLYTGYGGTSYEELPEAKTDDAE